ncbi:MAG: hypothetical protein JO061_11275 [Acidobacteriaceae bacterium]|nr:hypothetical protein [Acidobacteriaceae bacterium]
MFVVIAFGQQDRSANVDRSAAMQVSGEQSGKALQAKRIGPKVTLATGTRLAADQLPATISGASLPTPTASSLGGVMSFTAPVHEWINSIASNGTATASQPASSDLSDAGALVRTTSVNTFVGDQLFQSGRPWFDVQAFGALGDGQVTSDGTVTAASAVSSATISTTANHFQAGDIGKSVVCIACAQDGNGNTVNLIGSITAETPNSITLGSLTQNRTVAIAGTAQIFWGTLDYSAIQNAYSAACSAGGGTVYIPLPHKTFYLAATPLTSSISITACNGVKFLGAGVAAELLGDPGSNPLIVTTVQSIEISSLQLKNIHTPAINPTTDTQGSAVHCSGCQHLSIHHAWLTGGVTGVQIDAGSQYVDIGPNNVFNGLTEGAINVNGSSASGNSYVHVYDNRILNTVWKGYNGNQPHDINLEDCSSCSVTGNHILDNATTVPGPSAIQVAGMHYPGTMSQVLIQGNIATVVNPGATDTLACIVGGSVSNWQTRDYIVANNTCEGYGAGLDWSGLSTANQLTGFIVQGNTFGNFQGVAAQNGAIYITSWPVTDQDVSIVGNSLNGSGSGNSGAAGIAANNVSGMLISGNRVFNMPEAGIVLAGVQNSAITGNILLDNGQQSAGAYDGIICAAYASGCSFNAFSANKIYDDQRTPTQRYGITIGSTGLANHLMGNTFGPNGNQTADVNDSGTGTLFGSSIASDNQSTTLTGNLAPVTLLPAGSYNAQPATYRVSVNLVCAASVANSTVTVVVSYADPLTGTQSQSSGAQSCASAGKAYSIPFFVRSLGTAALTYSTSTANNPQYQMWTRVEEQ